MDERKLDVLVALHGGAHFIETPNPVMVLTGFKAMGPAAAVLERDGTVSLIVTPAWDRDRAAAACPGCSRRCADDAIAGLAGCLAPHTGSCRHRIGRPVVLPDGAWRGAWWKRYRMLSRPTISSTGRRR